MNIKHDRLKEKCNKRVLLHISNKRGLLFGNKRFNLPGRCKLLWM